MHLEYPRLRPYLGTAPDDDPDYVLVWDRLRVSDGPRRFHRRDYGWLRRFTGERSVRELAEQARAADGVPLTYLESLVLRLDEALFLDGPRFRRHLDAPVREPRCVGCYPGEAGALRRSLRALFTGPGGPGRPRGRPPGPPRRAALLPHIDYPRGGVTYAWGFKEVLERTDASLFVIVGTSHHSRHRFTLTRKDFRTPLGVVPTDQKYVDRLVRHYGPGLFDDEWLAHLPEHSIELEVVFLHYLYENVRPIRIVPLVVGSFHDCVGGRRTPGACADVTCMVRALRGAEEELGEPVCYIISGDLAHIGPKFGDDRPARGGWLAASRELDRAVVKAAETGRADDVFRAVADEGDARRICGLPPTWTVLEALRPGRGRLLHYDQYVHPRGYESVSFASMAFDQ